MRQYATMKPTGKAPSCKKIGDVSQYGEMLRTRRRELGYTQQTVAMMMNCSARLVADMEHGKPTVGFEHYLAYAQGLSLDVFLEVR